MHTTESRLLALAAAGFTGTITLSLSEGTVKITASLNRYETYQNDFKGQATGDGTKGAARLDAILRAGEAFLDDEDTDLLPVRLPPRPRLPDFDATEERREANRAAAVRQDEQARELVTADEEIAF